MLRGALGSRASNSKSSCSDSASEFINIFSVLCPENDSDLIFTPALVLDPLLAIFVADRLAGPRANGPDATASVGSDFFTTLCLVVLSFFGAVGCLTGLLTGILGTNLG